jgi:hypothetical protein
MKISYSTTILTPQCQYNYYGLLANKIKMEDDNNQSVVNRDYEDGDGGKKTPQ